MKKKSKVLYPHKLLVHITAAQYQKLSKLAAETSLGAAVRALIERAP